MFRTIIPRNVRLAEAPSFGKPALLHDKDSRGALAYLALAGEMIRREDETLLPASAANTDQSAVGTEMSSKKPSLGRGLNALMGKADTAPRPLVPAASPLSPPPSAPVAGPLGDRLTRLPLDVLQRGRYQPRFPHGIRRRLSELAASIRTQGVVQPILVRPLEATGAPAGGRRYEIIAGERRWRAAQLAELQDIPAIVREVRMRPRLRSR